MAEIKSSEEGKLINGENEQQTIPVRSSPPIKLKDKAGRGGIMFDMQKYFGFIPEKVHVAKVHGKSNTIIVSAVLTEEQLELEKKEKEKETKKASKKLKLKKD